MTISLTELSARAEQQLDAYIDALCDGEELLAALQGLVTEGDYSLEGMGVFLQKSFHANELGCGWFLPETLLFDVAPLLMGLPTTSEFSCIMPSRDFYSRLTAAAASGRASKDPQQAQRAQSLLQELRDVLDLGENETAGEDKRTGQDKATGKDKRARVWSPLVIEDPERSLLLLTGTWAAS
ncbi:MAG: hypothetical protein LBD25_06510 [Coriobacteriales bacterium]|jgi:hypothetical protein|nr:hypothetical protein [Coriobacteriales bacterium]